LAKKILAHGQWLAATVGAMTGSDPNPSARPNNLQNSTSKLMESKIIEHRQRLGDRAANPPFGGARTCPWHEVRA
jgi:hypothetical protein